MEPTKPSEEEVRRLADRADLRDTSDRPPAPVPTAGPLWWLVDRLGPFAAYIALALTVIAVLTAFVGGESWAWVGVVGLPISLFLVVYAVYLVRRRQQERAAEYMLARQQQEQARLEVARLVLEQSRRESDDNP